MSDDLEPELCTNGGPWTCINLGLARASWCDGCWPPCPDCGKPDGSFACRIRHINVSIGWGRAADER